MVHAENDAAIRRTRRRLIDLGRTDIRYHVVAHSEIMEREATHRALALAEMTGTRMTIVHISSCAIGRRSVPGAGARRRCDRRDLPAISLRRRGRSRSPCRGCRALRLFAAAALAAQPAASVAGARRWRHRSLVVRPFALLVRRQDRQIRHAWLPHDAERHSRDGDPAAAAVFRRTAERPPDARPLSRPHLAKCRVGLWPGAPQGQDRGRPRRRPGAVGPAAQLDDRPRGTSFARRLHAL